MRKRFLHKVFGLCMLGGFVTILGTAGASDLNLVTFNELLLRGVIGAGLLLIGYVGLKASNFKHIA